MSKGQRPEKIAALRELGLSRFGESSYQEAVQHFGSALDLQLDFIGNLQRNKVAKVLQLCDTVQSIASLPCLEQVQRCQREGQRCRTIFFEVNPLQHPTKQGFTSYAQLQRAAECFLLQPGLLRLAGLMTMAPQAPEGEIRRAFAECRQWHYQLRQDFDLGDCRQLSMGMSSDYPLAVAEGSTMIRLGSALFGARS